MTIIERLESRMMLTADMVVTWNNVTIDVLRADTTLPGPTWASRSLAMVHAAIFDAVNAIDRSYAPYLLHGPAPAGTNMDVAIASAAHRVLVDLYPQQTAMLDTKLNQSIAGVPNGVTQKSVQFGHRVADTILRARRNDGAGASSTYAPTGEPGHWEPDYLNPTQTALSPDWGGVKPFTMTAGSQFRPVPPPVMTSAAYAMAFEEVKAIGGDGVITPTTRTADQTEIGIFWGYDRPGMGAPPALYNQIVQVIAEQQNNTIVQNARLFALVNIAQADAGIAAWECKYVDDFWRPISGIRRAAADGNPSTMADATWTPLGAPGGGVIPNFTPPFPAYVSGHATFGAATFKTLENFYGTDQMSFMIGSDELPGVTRSFSSFSEASDENGRSRIYLGIHWDFDNVKGQHMGRQVADWVFERVAATGNQQMVHKVMLTNQSLFSEDRIGIRERAIDGIAGETDSVELV